MSYLASSPFFPLDTALEAAANNPWYSTRSSVGGNHEVHGEAVYRLTEDVSAVVSAVAIFLRTVARPGASNKGMVILSYASSRLPVALLILPIVFASSLAVAASSPVAQIAPRQPTTVELGFQNMYNLDFQGAHHQFDAWQQVHPDDPMGPVSHAAAFLFDEFARLGVLEAELFVDDHTFDNRKKLVPDPQVKTKFESELNEGDRLATNALSKQPHDTNAQFAKVLAMGLRSDYAALIEKRDLAALSYTKQGRLLAVQLLKEKPDDYDAYLAVGVENYLAGIKPAPVRWLLQMGGVQTDKEQGIKELREAALHGNLLAPFAKLLLAVAALRDKDTGTACGLLQELSGLYPRNPLYSRELYRCH